MKITVLNMKDAVNYIPKGKAIIFRMGDNFPFPKLKGEYLHKSLYSFSDVDDFSDYCIKDEDSLKISEKVKEFKNEIDEVVVHCQYGQGRSPAVGYAISEFFNLNDINYLEKYPDINIYVYEKLKEALLK